MAKEFIREVRFRAESLERIADLNTIIEEYQQQGLRLTARQLYYQCVSRDLLPNTPADYKKLTSLLTDARYAGLVDWDAIEDRGREPVTQSEWPNINALVESALRAYRLPRWKDQPAYAELWVEKQALAGVLEPLASEHHVTLCVNKGYSSASAMKESADRIKRHTISDEKAVRKLFSGLVDVEEEHGKGSPEYQKCLQESADKLKQLVRPTTIFYLGDHDPSGEDMVRDIEKRLEEFGVLLLTVKKVGLTMPQIRQYHPPPNPAKIADPRAKAYIAKHGTSSWEVDALPPNVLAQLIRTAFRSVIDPVKMDLVKSQEKLDKELLRKAVASLRSGPAAKEDEDENESPDEGESENDDEADDE